MDKRSLAERDICTKFILPAVKRAGWDEMVQVREEVYFTKGRIIVRGKLVTRGKAKTREEALTHIENAILMILTEMERKGVSPPADEPVPGGVLLNISTE